MGLEQYMGDLGLDDEDTQEGQEEDSSSDGPDYKYTGDKELLDISRTELNEYVDTLDYVFESEQPVVGQDDLCMVSEEGNFQLVIRYPPQHKDWDCVLVTVLDVETGYDVIDPYPVYFVDGWKEELAEAIDQVIENKDDLVFCDRCGSVMIIRTTNTTQERIRGCSNYPDCRHTGDI